MKKYIIVFILFLLLLFVISKPIYNMITNEIIDYIAIQFEKKEVKRAEKIANGDIVRGKDTVLIWKNKYDITKHMGEKALDIYINGSSYQIVDKITKYRVVNDKLYIVSEEGYVIIDENKKSRVFITVPENEYEKNFSDDTADVLDYITYLSDFQFFSEEEQKRLSNM